MPKKQRSDTSRPIGCTTAYGLYQRSYLKSYEEFDIEKTKLVYQCTENWKKMLPKDKESWFQSEREDRERFAKELEEWKQKNPLIGEAKRHTKPPPKRALKAKDAPKHPLSAFFWWAYSERAEMSTANPELGVCKISKMLGEKWQKIDPDVRMKFEIMAERDKIRYREEKEEYLSKIRENNVQPEKKKDAMEVTGNEKNDVGEATEDKSKGAVEAEKSLIDLPTRVRKVDNTLLPFPDTDCCFLEDYDDNLFEIELP